MTKFRRTYCRSVAIDLYQTIMRGCIRENADAEYYVVCVIYGLDIITVLEQQLPKASFSHDDSEIIRKLFEGGLPIDIIRELQLVGKNIDYRKIQKIKNELCC